LTENPKSLTENPKQDSGYQASFLDNSVAVPDAQRLKKRKLLIENKVSFYGPDSELSIYDTYRSAERVRLDADNLLYCGMVTGKKVMYSNRHYGGYGEGQVFLPHESFVIPPGESVEIDFPNACEATPTTCLAIDIPKERIETISEQMNDLVKIDGVDHGWLYQPEVIHTHHSSDTQILIERIVNLFTLNNNDREIMIGWSVSELITRLLRQQGRELLLNYCQNNPDATGMTAAVSFVEQNFAQPLIIDKLCQIACMSRSKLYTEFKKQLGCSPNEYQQQVRLKNAALLLSKGKTVTQTCFEVGFKALSHFSRRFILFYNCTPRQFKERHRV